MSDEKKTPSFLDGKAPEAIVRGGTHTDKSERYFKARYADAEKRRDVAAAERKLSRGQKTVASPDDPKAQVLLPGSIGADAVQYTNQFTETPEIPKSYIPLFYRDLGELCCADLIKGTDNNPDELMLIIVCPGCTRDGHKKQDENQLQIRQSNKAFEFVPGGPISKFEFQNPETGLVEIYHSAGMIKESEPFECPDCRTKMRIVCNMLIEE